MGPGTRGGRDRAPIRRDLVRQPLVFRTLAHSRPQNCTLTASIEPYRTACTNYSYIFYTIDVAYQCLVADGSLHLNLCFPEMCTREDIASMIENNFPGPNSTCTRTETFNPIPTPSPLPSPTASPTPSPGADAPDASATASISLLAAAVVALLTVARQDN